MLFHLSICPVLKYDNDSYFFTVQANLFTCFVSYSEIICQDELMKVYIFRNIVYIEKRTYFGFHDFIFVFKKDD